MSKEYELKITASKGDLDRIAAWLTLPDNFRPPDSDCSDWKRSDCHFSKYGYESGQRFEEAVKLAPRAGFTLLETCDEDETSRRKFFTGGRLVSTEVFDDTTGTWRTVEAESESQADDGRPAEHKTGNEK